jgi:transposase-like protein
MKTFTITEDFPKSEIEFDKRFSDIDKCYDYLFQTIWPDGFCCKVCGHTKFWISAKHIYICTRCEHQHSLTAGTIMDSSKKPVTYWFKAMWWFTTRRSGVNAINLQELLGLGSYGTAWSWLQKLRRCTIRKDREKLSGRVEVDEFYIGGKTSGKRGRGAASKTAVVAAVERDEKKKRIGRIRLKVIPDCSSMSLNTFVEENVEPGSTIVTDAWRSYQSIDKERYAHIERNLTKTPDKESVLHGIHLVATLVKRLIRSTHQCRFEPRYLQNYLDEYVFRFNRRKSASIGKKFMRIVQQAVVTAKITLEDILLDGHLAEINLSLGLYG